MVGIIPSSPTYINRGRIDYILTSQNLTSRIQSSEIGPLLISDHAPNISDMHPNGTNFIWHFPAYLVKDESFCDLLKGWWLECATQNEAQAGDPALFWNAAKAVLRGRMRAYATSYKRNAKLAHDKASLALREAYTAFKTLFSPKNRANSQSAKTEYELWVERRIQVYRSHFDTELFHFGNKPGRLIANLARGRRRPSHITALRGREGFVRSDLKQISLILKEFYATLYSDHLDSSPAEKGRVFLQKLSLPRVTDAQKDLLNGVISETEIRDTVKKLVVGKGWTGS